MSRIYHKRMNNALSARRHYRVLVEHAGKEHPFHHETMPALKELSTVETVS